MNPGCARWQRAAIQGHGLRRPPQGAVGSGALQQRGDVARRSRGDEGRDPRNALARQHSGPGRPQGSWFLALDDAFGGQLPRILARCVFASSQFALNGLLEASDAEFKNTHPSFTVFTNSRFILQLA